MEFALYLPKILTLNNLTTYFRLNTTIILYKREYNLRVALLKALDWYTRILLVS